MESWCCPPSRRGVSNYWGVIRLLCQVKCSAHSLHDCWAVSATAALALCSRDNVDTWNCVNKTKYGPSWRAGLLCLYLRFSCSVLICLRGHYSVNQLPLKYGNCVSWAINQLYGDDETHSTTCVQLLARRHLRRLASACDLVHQKQADWSDEANLGSVTPLEANVYEAIRNHPRMGGGWRLLWRER